MRVEGNAGFDGKTLLLNLRVVPTTAFDHERLAEIGAARGRVVVQPVSPLMLDKLIIDLAISPPSLAEKAGREKAKAGTAPPVTEAANTPKE